MSDHLKKHLKLQNGKNLGRFKQLIDILVNIQNKNKSTSSFSSKSNLKIEKQKRELEREEKKAFGTFLEYL
jgi:hypothetical protein